MSNERTYSTGDNLKLNVSTDIDDCTPLRMGAKAIARLYFPMGSKCVGIAPHACEKIDGVYTPCLNPLVEPAVPLSHTFDVEADGGNLPLAPQAYDAAFVKFLATFSDATTDEEVPFTLKS